MMDRDAFDRFIAKLYREKGLPPPKISHHSIAEIEEHIAPPVSPAIEQFIRSTERRPK